MNAEQYRALVNKLEQIQQIDEQEAPAAAPTATAGTPPPPAAAPAAAPAKSQQNYNLALQQIKGLYAKAQVAYPPQDDIIRQRFGLPPALPPFEQWDGAMPKATGADFLTRNVLGRDASKAVASQQTANDLSNAGNAKADSTVAAKVKELNALVAKLGGGAPAAAAPTPAAQSGQAAPVTPQNDPAMKDFMGESTNLKSLMAKMLKENFNMELPEENDSFDSFGTPVPKGSAQATTADAPPATKGADPELVKQIQAVMAEINANMDENNPDPEASTALAAAQAALDKAQTAPAAAPAATGSAALDGTKPGADPATTIPGGPETAAGGPATAAPANQTFGQAFAAARKSGAKEFDYKGKKYSTAQKGENPALDAAMAGKKPTAPTTPATPTAPAQSGQATPAAPMQKELPPGIGKPPVLPLGTASKPPAPVMDPNKPGFDFKKASAAAMGTKESVGYNEDQTLARIVSLANIGR
jgi:hypothetical protein